MINFYSVFDSYAFIKSINLVFSSNLAFMLLIVSASSDDNLIAV